MAKALQKHLVYHYQGNLCTIVFRYILNKLLLYIFTRSCRKVTNDHDPSVFMNVFKKQLKIGRPKREIIPMQTISAQVAAIGVAPLGIPNWGSLGENHILNSPYI